MLTHCVAGRPSTCPARYLCHGHRILRADALLVCAYGCASTQKVPCRTDVGGTQYRETFGCCRGLLTPSYTIQYPPPRENDRTVLLAPRATWTHHLFEKRQDLALGHDTSINKLTAVAPPSPLALFGLVAATSVACAALETVHHNLLGGALLRSAVLDGEIRVGCHR